MATMMGQEDTQSALGNWLEQIRLKAELHFDAHAATLLRVGSDHGADFWVVTGLVEANRPFDVWVMYVEEADNIRYTIMQMPEDGSEPLLRVIEWEVGYG